MGRTVYERQRYGLKCSKCNKESRFKKITLKYAEEPNEILTSIQCTKCDQASYEITHNIDKHKNGAIKIICNFNSKEDLSRFVSLREMSIVKFKGKKVIYEYMPAADEDVVVEMILRTMIYELCQMFELCDSLELTGTYGHTQSTENLVKELSVKEKKLGKVDGAEKNAIKTVLFLTEMLQNPNFTLEIKDDSGFTRVYPRGKKPSEVNGDDIEGLNDDMVTHQRVK
ncbi:hypothetical protein DMUE_2338 [Dictyocoela muelleri]|nr:hypothetical protein DMUE_2338 [Dictyocoela muelleri]